MSGAPPAASARSLPLDRRDAVVCLALGVSACVLFALTAARDIVVGDTAELVTAAITLGVAHPPGYPLLTMLGHVFSWLPVGFAPFRVNLLAVACGAGAVVFVYLTARSLPVWRSSREASSWSLGAACLLAVNPLFWTWSLAMEAFPFNSAIAAACLFFLVRWHEAPERIGFLIAAAFLSGLAMSNHLTFVLLGPAILFAVWRRRKVLFDRPRLVAMCAGAVLVGLLPYVYIPWAASRDPFLNWGRVSAFGDFVALVTRADYGSGQLVGDPGSAGGAAVDRVIALFASFTPLEAALIVAGAVLAVRRLRWYFWFCVLAFGVTGPAFVAYANLDLAQPYALFVLQRFFLLAHVVVAPLAAPGLVSAADTITALVGPARRRLAEAAVAVGTLAAVGATIALRYETITQRGNHVARQYVEDILTTLKPRSILLVTNDTVAFPLAYLQAVEGRRPDVTPVWLPVLRGPRWYTEQLRARHRDLVIPRGPDEAPGAPLSLRALVEANPDRPIALVGPPPDDSLKGRYWFFGPGLVADIEPVTRTKSLADLVSGIERFAAAYRVPAADRIKAGTFEQSILRAYAVPAQNAGVEYEQRHLDAEAEKWYRRALAVDPSFVEPKDALARIAARSGKRD